jgi:hypothetical protein
MVRRITALIGARCSGGNRSFLQSLRAWRRFLPAGQASIVLRNLMSIGVIEAC